MRSLKQTIETKLNGRIEKIKEAEAFLIERENKLSNTQTHRSAGGKNPAPFRRSTNSEKSSLLKFINFQLYNIIP